MRPRTPRSTRTERLFPNTTLCRSRRAAGAIMDDGGGNARAVASIARIDILHHLLAPLVLEIDVDVGRLAAILGHEAREEQVMLQGVDRRDAKQEAADRIGGRSAALPQDRRLPRPGEPHQNTHGPTTP